MGRCIRIALVNNMPDPALARTQRQFFDLLSRAAPELPIKLGLFALSAVPRGDAGRTHLSRHAYRDAADIARLKPDAVIVTGTEPRSAELENEPYWDQLVSLFDWLAEADAGAIFSCLAAQAATLHFDGVRRQPLPEKRFGMFMHVKVCPHPLTESLGPTLTVAHSRCNELPAAALLDRGYRILTVAPDAGADLFVRNGRDRWLFFQGHPEYDSGALGREYLRDVKRYLARERASYPARPANYFDRTGGEEVDAFRLRALAGADPSLIDKFPISACLRAEERGTPSAEIGVIRAWLKNIADAKFGARTQRLTRRSAIPEMQASVRPRGIHLAPLLNAKG
jgi:homoserine O-succinyltransferase